MNEDNQEYQAPSLYVLAALAIASQPSLLSNAQSNDEIPSRLLPLLRKLSFFPEQSRQQIISGSDTIESALSRLALPRPQTDAVTKLSSSGLTKFHLVGENWFNSQEHVKALQQLMGKHNLEATVAISQLQHLKDYQVQGIARGLTHDEVILLHNQFQVAALCGQDINDTHALRHNGLTIADFKAASWFNSWEHVTALQQLMDKHNVEATAAISQLQHSEDYQVQGIALGLTYDEVIPLHNQFQVAALCGQNIDDSFALQRNNLTVAHFKNAEWFNSQIHVYALIMLMRHHKQKAAKAISQLENLKDYELNGISLGLTKQQATQLHNSFQVTALCGEDIEDKEALKHLGLTINHFKKAPWFNSENHLNALRILMQEHKLKATKAISQLKKLQDYQLQAISLGLTFEQATCLDNKSQFDIFCRLTLEERMVPHDAMNELQNLYPANSY